MSTEPRLPAQTRRILDLARNDRPAARAALAELGVESQVALVCETPAGRRAELLDLCTQPELVIPALPEAELCYTAKAVGVIDSGWLLAHASEEQIVACLDLDAWSDAVPDRARIGQWWLAIADASEETLLRASRALDPELLMLMLSDRIEVAVLMARDEEIPLPGSQTLDGQFYYRARRDDDDLADVSSLLDSLFRNDYWRYFRLLQAVVWELPTENEEWALRWRNGRLQDLGFPERDEALALYAVLPDEQRDHLPEADELHRLGEWPLPIWMPRIPIALDSALSIFRALAELPEDERRPKLFSFLALANRVAVAEGFSLGESDSIPRALEKGARIVSRGLDHLSSQHGLGLGEVLRRTTLERLFRVGFTLAPEPRRAAAKDGEPLPS